MNTIQVNPQIQINQIRQNQSGLYIELMNQSIQTAKQTQILLEGNDTQLLEAADKILSKQYFSKK